MPRSYTATVIEGRDADTVSVSRRSKKGSAKAPMTTTPLPSPSMTSPYHQQKAPSALKQRLSRVWPAGVSVNMPAWMPRSGAPSQSPLVDDTTWSRP